MMPGVTISELDRAVQIGDIIIDQRGSRLRVVGHRLYGSSPCVFVEAADGYKMVFYLSDLDQLATPPWDLAAAA